MNWPAVTFLAPLSGLVAAGVAVPVLLLWYFLKLRRRPVRISSTLLWQQAVQDLQVNAPFRWLRPSWLLLLQLLLLAALVGAIARPALDLPGEPPERMILVIDRSASMSARDVSAGPGGTDDINVGADRVTRLDDAKRQAKELVARLSGRSRAMIITMAAQPEVVANYSRDRGALANAIDAIVPTDQPADPGALWRVVEAFAVGGDERGGEAANSSMDRAAVVLFSDGAIRRTPGVGAGPASLRFIRCAPPESAPADNLAIVGFNARRAYDDPATVQVFTRIQSVNSSTTPIDAALTLSLNGEVIDGSAITLPTDASPAKPASVTRTFNFQNTEGGLLTAAIARGDALPADNSASLLLRPPGAPRILLVQPNEPNARADQVLVDGLGWFKPRELARVRLAEYERAAASTATTNPNPGVFDLLVFDRVRPSRLPPAGKPTMSFGAGLPLTGLSVEAYAPDDPAGASTGFAFWQRTHPVMRYVSLNAVTVFSPLKVTPPAEGVRADSGPITSTVLASGAGGPLILLLEGGAPAAGGTSARRLVIGFSPTDSWWFKELSFPVFLKNAVDYLTLTGDESAGRGFTTVEAVTVAPIAGATDVTATGPETLRRKVPPEVTPRLTLGILPRAGVYELAGATAADSDVPRVPVNLLDDWESRIGSSSNIDAGGSSTPATGIGSATPREIWHWLVALAAGLLMLEWLLFAWRMRV